MTLTDLVKSLRSLDVRSFQLTIDNHALGKKIGEVEICLDVITWSEKPDKRHARFLLVFDRLGLTICPENIDAQVTDSLEKLRFFLKEIYEKDARAACARFNTAAGCPSPGDSHDHPRETQETPPQADPVPPETAQDRPPRHYGVPRIDDYRPK